MADLIFADHNHDACQQSPRQRSMIAPVLHAPSKRTELRFGIVGRNWASPTGRQVGEGPECAGVVFQCHLFLLCGLVHGVGTVWMVEHIAELISDGSMFFRSRAVGVPCDLHFAKQLLLKLFALVLWGW